jgi:hypothetical protein
MLHCWIASLSLAMARFDAYGFAFSAAAASRLAMSESTRFMNSRQNQPVPDLHRKLAVQSTWVPSPEGVSMTSA